MQRMRSNPTPICLIVAMMTIVSTVSVQPTLASLIQTQDYREITDRHGARDRVIQFMARDDVRELFVNQGVDPEEAAARVQNLSDEEIHFLAQHIEQLPAGGDGLGFVIGVLLIVLLVLLILRVA